MYRPAYLLSPSKVPSAVIKKASWGGQGRSTTVRPPDPKIRNTPVSSPSDQTTSSLKTRILFKTKMETALRQLAEDIWRSLGPGYSESVYHCAFEVGLRKAGVYYETERIVPVYYEGQNVGHVRADLIVDRSVVLELKSVSKLNEVYRIQTRNYLKLLGLDRGFLINFPDKNGPIEFEEIVNPRPTPAPLDPIDC